MPIRLQELQTVVATVTHTGPQEVVGLWKDGRKGTYVVRKDFGASVEGEKRSGEVGKFEGYGPLLIQIIKFYKTGRPPVPAEETLEILAFMEAADASKHQDGGLIGSHTGKGEEATMSRRWNRREVMGIRLITRTARNVYHAQL
jgi:hypothetical protein